MRKWEAQIQAFALNELNKILMMNGTHMSRASSRSSVYQDTVPGHDLEDISTRVSAPVGIAAHAYAAKITRLIQLMTDLRASGAQALIDLPRIVVIGNQSAGKSSLVEAISGITVPRSAGTCTRCPMECRLQNAPGPWRCQVLLRYERDENGNRLEEVREQKFGPALSDRSLLEDTLRRAQLAILNPSVQASRFVDYDLSDDQSPPLGSERQLQFSCNVVCMDLESPEVADLSFIDLPGIISNVGPGEDRNNIELIKNLVREHIQGNALILLAITMRDDIENQSAAFLAKEADPEGMRTIGALTKPDLLEDGEHGRWVEVLNGRRHPLTHGYYVTKQPGIQDLAENLGHATARERERVFFNTNKYWTSASSEIRNRMGVPKLTSELSKLLSELIEKTLPALRDDARSQLAKAKKEIDCLPPPPPQHPVAELLHLVSEFSQDVKHFVMGYEGHEDLIQHCRPAYMQFKQDILSTRPQFSASESRAGNDSVESNVDDVLMQGEDEPTGTAIRQTMYVDQVEEMIKKFLTRQLPYNVPFSAKTALIRQSFEDWPLHLQNCFEIVRVAFLTCLDDLIVRHFKRYSNGGLFEHVRVLIDKEFDALTDNMKYRIDWLMQLEDQPFTQNDHYLSSCRDKYIAHFKQRRQNLPMHEGAAIQHILSKLSEVGITGIIKEDLPKLLGPDKYEEEIIVMAEVCAYFRVSYKRIIDDWPRIIDLDFLRAFSKLIQQALIDGLELGEHDSARRAESYLSEDPTTVLRRKDLEMTKARLEGVLSKLFRFNIP